MKIEALDIIFAIIGILFMLKGFFYSGSVYDSIIGYIVFMGALILLRVSKVIRIIERDKHEREN